MPVRWLGSPYLRGRPLLVCHCFAVNDRRIREVVAAGARDEFDIAAACGAGTDCGGCLPAVNRVLDDCLGCPLSVSMTMDATPLRAVG